jgi:hypothetical protein
MFFAIINGEKTRPSPKEVGECPFCNNSVFSKCGKTNVWHWAHFKDTSCDSWYEPESFWHYYWKMSFGKENVEHIITKDGIRHIADIFTSSEVVIELQNSPITSEIIEKRERFYGERMIWIVNGDKFLLRFNLSRYNFNNSFLDIILKRPIIDKTPLNQLISFTWQYPRRSWQSAQRPLFIDFAGDDLFWVLDGMGESYGTGKFISKQSFFKKYCGDYSSYFQTVLEDFYNIYPSFNFGRPMSTQEYLNSIGDKDIGRISNRVTDLSSNSL